MANYDSNYAIAQEISARIGNAPIPFDSVYSIALQIYQELGGEESEFDSVYSILLGILPLAESIANRTSITDIDELPEAKDNNNIYRLNSDDKVYMSVRYPDTITNKLPDEQQIDKAFLWETEEDFYYYKGAFKGLFTDGEINGYGWLEIIPDSDEWYFYLTEDNAENIQSNSVCYYFDSMNMDSIDLVNKTITGIDTIDAYQGILSDDGETPISATYNAPEADCIGNATLIDSEFLENGVYTGEVITVFDSESRNYITGYKWTDIDNSNYCFLTIKPASEIYFTGGGGEAYANTMLYYVDISDLNPEEWLVDSVIGFEQLYIPQLNAPDSEQVGKASVDDNADEYSWYFTGNEETFVYSGQTLTGYTWITEDEPEETMYSLVPASEVYFHLDEDDYPVTQTVFYRKTGSEVYTQGVETIDIVKYTRAIENWAWRQIPIVEEVIKLNGTGSTELAKLNKFTETGVYSNIQVYHMGSYCPAILKVHKLNSTVIYQNLTFSVIADFTNIYCIIRKGVNQEWGDRIKVLEQKIDIANTGSTELAKLNNFTETGVYSNIHLTFLGHPATLIIEKYNNTSIKQWIKYYGYDDDSQEYFERVWGRSYWNNSWHNYSNNPISIIEVH